MGCLADGEVMQDVATGLELIPILPQFVARPITFLPPSKNSTGKGTTQLSVCVDPKHWPVNHSKPSMAIWSWLHHWTLITSPVRQLGAGEASSDKVFAMLTRADAAQNETLERL